MLLDDIFADKIGVKLITMDPRFEVDEMMQRLFVQLEKAERFSISDLWPDFQRARHKPGGYDLTVDPGDVIPPYPCTYFEFHEEYDGIRATYGLLMACESMREKKFSVFREMLIDEPEPFEVFVGKAVNMQEIEADFEIQATLLLHLSTTDKYVYTEVPTLIYLARKNGTFVTRPMGIGGMHNLFPREVVEAYRQAIPTCYFVFFVMDLLTCKNVSTREDQISPKLQKARARKGRRPLLTFKKLIINTKRPRYKPGEVGGDGERRAFHKVRHHFHTYTEAAPLFGRLTGKFYIPDHTRGSRDAGEVKKRYKVK